MSQAPEPSAPEAEGMAGPKVGWQAGPTLPIPGRRGQWGHQALLPPLCDGVSLRQPTATLVPSRGGQPALC